MGFPPPPDLPAPTPPTVGGSFSTPKLPAIALCGFKFPPSLFFIFGFKLPSIAFPPKIPLPYLHLALNCNLSNPIDVSAGVAYGGGRASNNNPDPDLDEGT
jgi:hypothetical protein